MTTDSKVFTLKIIMKPPLSTYIFLFQLNFFQHLQHKNFSLPEDLFGLTFFRSHSLSLFLCLLKILFSNTVFCNKKHTAEFLSNFDDWMRKKIWFIGYCRRDDYRFQFFGSCFNLMLNWLFIALRVDTNKLFFWVKPHAIIL